jgi:hypothetical protein
MPARSRSSSSTHQRRRIVRPRRLQARAACSCSQQQLLRRSPSQQPRRRHRSSGSPLSRHCEPLAALQARSHHFHWGLRRGKQRRSVRSPQTSSVPMEGLMARRSHHHTRCTQVVRQQRASSRPRADGPWMRKTDIPCVWCHVFSQAASTNARGPSDFRTHVLTAFWRQFLLRRASATGSPPLRAASRRSSPWRLPSRSHAPVRLLARQTPRLQGVAACADKRPPNPAAFALTRAGG